MHDDVKFRNKFSELADLINKEFERNFSLYGDKIKCRKGCSQCCYQIFRITAVDAGIIGEHIRSLTPDERDLLKQKASAYLNKRDLSQKNSEEEFTKIPKEPCPALNESGECMIYEARPVICRRFGPPVYDYKNPGRLYACELNFDAGEEITDNELIPAQTEIGMKWDELKTEYNIENGINKNASATIAEAIFNS